jgi:hypothetical protein
MQRNSTPYILATRPGEEIRTHVATAPEHLKAILKAVADGKAVWGVVPQIAGPFSLPLPLKPFILVLGDDMATAMGPDAFDHISVERALKACRAVIVAAGEATARVYDFAARHARAGESVVIVETQPAHQDAWVELVRRVNPTAGVLLSSPTVSQDGRRSL